MSPLSCTAKTLRYSHPRALPQEGRKTELEGPSGFSSRPGRLGRPPQKVVPSPQHHGSPAFTPTASLSPPRSCMWKMPSSHPHSEGKGTCPRSHIWQKTDPRLRHICPYSSPWPTLFPMARSGPGLQKPLNGRSFISLSRVTGSGLGTQVMGEKAEVTGGRL